MQCFAEPSDNTAITAARQWAAGGAVFWIQQDHGDSDDRNRAAMQAGLAALALPFRRYALSSSLEAWPADENVEKHRFLPASRAATRRKGGVVHVASTGRRPAVDGISGAGGAVPGIGLILDKCERGVAAVAKEMVA